MISLKDFSDKVIQNSRRDPDNGRSGFGLVTPSKQPLGDPRVSRAFTGWLSKQNKSDTPITPPRGVVSAMAKGGKVNGITEVGEHGPELLVNNTVVPLNKHDRKIGQKRGNLPKGNLSALLSHIRHREYGGDVPDDTAEQHIDMSQETPNDMSTAYGADVQGQPDEQTPAMPPAQEMPQQPVQQDEPDTGDIYSQIAQGYAQKIAALTNKDYGPKHHGGLGTILKGAGIGALQGLAHSDPRNGFAAELGAAVGGAGTGGVAGGIDSSNPQRAIDDIRKAKLINEAAQNQKLGMGQAQLEDVMAKPGDRQAKNEIALAESNRKAHTATQSNLTRQYNNLPSYSESDADDKAFGDEFAQVFGYRPPEKNATTQSKQIIDQRDGQVYLVQTDKQGGQKVSKLLKPDGTPLVIESKEQLASADRAQQRELQKLIADNRNVTSINVANINAGSRRDVANITQGGLNSRQGIALAAQRSLAEYNAAQKAGNQAAAEKAKQDYLRLKTQYDTFGTDPEGNVKQP